LHPRAPAATTDAEFDNPGDLDWGQVGTDIKNRYGNVEIELLFSASLCRFRVLPWISSNATVSKVRDYVEDTFSRLADVSRDSHHFQIDLPEFGEPIRVIAYPRRLVSTIKAGLARGGLKLSRVAHTGIVVAQKHFDRVANGDACLAYPEADGITGLSFVSSKLSQIESLDSGSGGLNGIGAWMARRSMMSSSEPRFFWLGSTPAPDEYAGTVLGRFAHVPSNAGHGILQSWV
jgi:hypothetical protein